MNELMNSEIAKNPEEMTDEYIANLRQQNRKEKGKLAANAVFAAIEITAIPCGIGLAIRGADLIGIAGAVSAASGFYLTYCRLAELRESIRNNEGILKRKRTNG